MDCRLDVALASDADQQRGAEAVLDFLAGGVQLDLAVTPRLAFVADDTALQTASIRVSEAMAIGAECPEPSHLLVQFESDLRWTGFVQPDQRISGALKLDMVGSSRLAVAIDLSPAVGSSLDDWDPFFASLQDIMYGDVIPSGAGWSSGVDLGDHGSVIEFPVALLIRGSTGGGSARIVLRTLDGYLLDTPDVPWTPVYP